MTVLVALRASQARRTSSPSTRAPRPSVSRRSACAAASSLTVRDLIKAALIQSANDAADALALSIAPDFPAFARADEREGGSARAARHALRPARRARCAAGTSRAQRDVTKLARAASCGRASFARPSTRRPRRSRAAARCTPGTTCSASSPQTFGVKTGHTSLAGLVSGGRGARPGRHGLRDAARQPDARRAQRRPRVAARSGGSRSSASSRRSQGGRIYATVAGAATARRRSSSSRARPLLTVARRRPAPDGDRRRRGGPSRCPSGRGQVLGQVEIRAGSRFWGRASSWLLARLTSPVSVGTSTLVRGQDAPSPGPPL